MQKYGILKDGNLYTSLRQIKGYKPVEYVSIPDSFDQTKQYIEQGEIIDNGEYITVEVEIKELPIDISEESNDGEF